MSPRLAAACAAFLVLTAACSSDSLESLEPVVTETSEPAPSADPTESAPTQAPPADEEPAAGTTLDALGVDWPVVSPDEVDWAKLPGAPAGFTASDLQTLAGPLKGWATRAALDSATWDGSSAPADILAPIGDTAYLAVNASRASVSPQVAVGSTFGKGVEVQGAPRMTTAWRTTTTDTPRGKAVRLTLQTRTAYQVKADDRDRVIGVIREHTLGTLRGGTPQGGLSIIGWYEYGASACNVVLNDTLVPDRDVATKDLQTFVKLGSNPAFAKPQIAEKLDSAFKQRCADQA